MPEIKTLTGDCREWLRKIKPDSIDCCVTSPPYFGLRDYGCDGQIGLEQSPADFVAKLVEVFREVRRVLKPEGTCWLNLGDSYAGSGKGAWDNKNGGQKEVYIPDANSPQTKIPKSWDGIKPKDLIGIPWRVALALQADGWYLRQDIIWHKPNPMPESVRDRCTKAHEYLFLLTKNDRYYFDAQAIAEPVAASTVTRLAQPTLSQQKVSDRVPGKTNGPMKAKPPRFGGQKYGDSASEKHRTKSSNAYSIAEGGLRNRRSVWTITTKPFKEAHFATFPPDLVEPCILAGCPKGGIVLDPFGGAGTTALVAREHGRHAVLIELNPDYVAIANKRLNTTSPE